MYCIFVRLLHGKNFFTHNCKFNLIGCNLLFTFYVTHSEFITYSALHRCTKYFTKKTSLKSIIYNRKLFYLKVIATLNHMRTATNVA